MWVLLRHSGVATEGLRGKVGNANCYALCNRHSQSGRRVRHGLQVRRRGKAVVLAHGIRTLRALRAVGRLQVEVVRLGGDAMLRLEIRPWRPEVACDVRDPGWTRCSGCSQRPLVEGARRIARVQGGEEEEREDSPHLIDKVVETRGSPLMCDDEASGVWPPPPCPLWCK